MRGRPEVVRDETPQVISVIDRIRHDVPANIRRKVHAQLISELGATARGLGASHCLTLLAATWPRWADRVGVKMKAMGPVMEIDAIENQVVLMDFTKALH